MLDHFYRPSASLPLHDETIQPWEADENAMTNLILSSAQHHHPKPVSQASPRITHRSHTPSQPTRPERLSNRHTPTTQPTPSRSFIEDNKQTISYFQASPAPHTAPMPHGYSGLAKTGYHYKHSPPHPEEFSIALEPINLSLMITPQEPVYRHQPHSKDLSSYIRFHSHKEREPSKGKHMTISGKTMKQESHEDNDRFQRMLKLKEAIRRRKVRHSQKAINVEGSPPESMQKSTPHPGQTPPSTQKSNPAPVSRLFMRTSDAARNRSKTN